MPSQTFTVQAGAPVQLDSPNGTQFCCVVLVGESETNEATSLYVDHGDFTQTSRVLSVGGDAPTTFGPVNTVVPAGPVRFRAIGPGCLKVRLNLPPVSAAEVAEETHDHDAEEQQQSAITQINAELASSDPVDTKAKEVVISLLPHLLAAFQSPSSAAIVVKETATICTAAGLPGPSVQICETAAAALFSLSVTKSTAAGVVGAVSAMLVHLIAAALIANASDAVAGSALRLFQASQTAPAASIPAPYEKMPRFGAKMAAKIAGSACAALLDKGAQAAAVYAPLIAASQAATEYSDTETEGAWPHHLPKPVSKILNNALMLSDLAVMEGTAPNGHYARHNYRLRLRAHAFDINGNVLYTNMTAPTAFEFRAGQYAVLPAIESGIKNQKAGVVRRLIIPAEATRSTNNAWPGLPGDRLVVVDVHLEAAFKV
ncbi:hypothetical protein HDU87_002935 [Geranomyces variabilis]|uniref:peptidylprolyl isomerase n=1 Tax=Geranomyces variabilis TaxID=109894 RepID=A0AAD5XNH3_9FUNG|nr:hypothetical protein HDU87_002935 [Geranomyces variabilis]